MSFLLSNHIKTQLILVFQSVDDFSLVILKLIDFCSFFFRKSYFFERLNLIYFNIHISIVLSEVGGLFWHYCNFICFFWFEIRKHVAIIGRLVDNFLGQLWIYSVAGETHNFRKVKLLHMNDQFSRVQVVKQELLALISSCNYTPTHTRYFSVNRYLYICYSIAHCVEWKVFYIQLLKWI